MQDEMRDRLAEIIRNAQINANPLTQVGYAEADALIDSGVTVQKWISVEDRLPEDSTEVNLYTRSRIVGTGFYDKYTKRWVQYYSGGAICVDATHWMPLPQPPKGE